MKREITHDDVRRIRNAVCDLAFAREELRIAGARRAADYVARALKSAQGAQRHAERVLSR